MRYFILIILTTLTFGASGADNVLQGPLPDDVRSIVKTHQAKIREIEEKMARLKAEVCASTEAALQPIQKRMTQRGDLEGALLVKKVGEVLSGDGCATASLIENDNVVRFKTYIIVDATFGAPGQTVSAMAFAKELTKGKLLVTAAKIGSDPAPNTRKSLTLTIANARGVKKTLVVPENQEVDLDEVLK